MIYIYNWKTYLEKGNVDLTIHFMYIAKDNLDYVIRSGINAVFILCTLIYCYVLHFISVLDILLHLKRLTTVKCISVS